MRRWNSRRQRQLCFFAFDRFLATDASFEINKVTLVVGLFLAVDAGCGVYKKNGANTRGTVVEKAQPLGLE